MRLYGKRMWHSPFCIFEVPNIDHNISAVECARWANSLSLSLSLSLLQEYFASALTTNMSKGMQLRVNVPGKGPEVS